MSSVTDRLNELKRLLEEDQDSLEYKLEGALIEFTEGIVKRMKELKLSRVQLAEQLGVSKAMVTKILKGSTNFTLKSMVNIATALDCELSISLPPCGFEARTFFVKRSNLRPSSFLLDNSYEESVPISTKASIENIISRLPVYKTQWELVGSWKYAENQELFIEEAS